MRTVLNFIAVMYEDVLMVSENKILFDRYLDDLSSFIDVPDREYLVNLVDGVTTLEALLHVLQVTLGENNLGTDKINFVYRKGYTAEQLSVLYAIVLQNQADSPHVVTLCALSYLGYFTLTRGFYPELYNPSKFHYNVFNDLDGMGQMVKNYVHFVAA